MNRKSQKWCAWSGILSIVFFFIGFWPMAKFMPPLLPTVTGPALASFYLDNAFGIIIGAICVLFSAGLLVFFYAGISVQMSRIEGRYGPLSLAQLALGVLAVVPFLPAAVTMCVIVFRPDRDPADIQLMSDFVWIMLFMTAAPLMVQFCVIGFAILTDSGKVPVFPRWTGYLTLWCATLAFPGNIIAFFHQGPFAWSGIFGYWIPASLFGVWTITMCWALLAAIAKEPVLSTR